MLLQTIWFYLWGLLWAVFFMTDGFDFGVGALYPFLGRSEEDKRIMILPISSLSMMERENLRGTVESYLGPPANRR